MMNWMEQTRDMMKVWMDSQQQMMKTFTDSMMGTPSSPTADAASSAWDRTLKTWESSFKNFIETQALWARMFVRNTMSGMEGEQAAAFTKAIEETTQMWTEAQQALWENWSMMVRQMDPSKMGDMMSPEGMTKMMEMWREQMKKVADMQAEWQKQMQDMMK